MICLPQIQDAMRGPVAIDCMLLAPFDTHFDCVKTCSSAILA